MAKVNGEKTVFSKFTLKRYYPKWWERVALFFIRGRIIEDGGHSFIFKQWRGKIYVVEEIKNG